MPNCPNCGKELKGGIINGIEFYYECPNHGTITVKQDDNIKINESNLPQM